MAGVKKNKGFTLIELSIVIVIIGLIVAGVVGGQNLVRQAKLRAVVSDFNKYVVAINAFKLEYGHLPGDMPNASDYWGASDGDGDGMLGENPTLEFEDLYSWNHLVLSEIIPGNYTGTVISGGVGYEEGINAPKASVTNSAFALAVSQVYTRNIANYLRLASPSAPHGYNLYGASLTAPEAYNIEVKVDDGLADTGRYSTVRAPSLGSGCVQNAWNAATPGNWILSDSTTIACTVYNWYGNKTF